MAKKRTAKKRKPTSRAQKVAVGIGRALGSLQARLDRLNATEIKAVIKRAQSMLAAIGPNTSGGPAAKRTVTGKAAKKSAQPRRKASAPNAASRGR